MRFPRYPEYKDSGVAWLGEVPNHWNLFHLKRDLTFLTSGSRGWADHYSSDGALFIRIGNLTRDSIKLDLADVQRVAVPDGTEGERTKVQAGDLLFSITAFLGSVAVAPPDLEPSYVSQHVALARLRQILFNPPWVGYVALSHIGKTYLGMQGYGGTKIQLSLNDVAELPIPTPPYDEQSAIAAFLDHETAKIDALVAEQEKLIDLLKEKRQAVISHAVTKGLDPDVPMKDSGVEWLGQVPEHWHVVPVAYRYEVQLGKMLDSSRISGEHLKPYLRVFDVQWGKINVVDLPEMDFDDEHQQRFRLRDGDLLVNEGGSYVGRSAIWNGELDECYYQKALHRLRPYNTSADATRFFYYVMDYATKLGVFVAGGNQATIEHLTAESFRRYRFGFPPLSEQHMLADYLDKEVRSIDLLVAESQHAIDLLKERRAALISAAVTGKIDVRTYHPELTEAA